MKRSHVILFLAAIIAVGSLLWTLPARQPRVEPTTPVDRPVLMVTREQFFSATNAGTSGATNSADRTANSTASDQRND